MGLFDFLKVTVADGKTRKAPPGRPAGNGASASVVEFDGKSFPLTGITTKGFSAGGFDGSLIKGQTARVTVKVNDDAGKFSFAAAIGVSQAEGGKLIGEWSVLTPEVEGVIRKYLQIRKQKTGR